jgi:protein phosphatase
LQKVVCEQKHMGSRAVVVVCRDREAAYRRFGITQDEIGVCYTRTGRRFFAEDGLERDFLKRVQTAVTNAGLWDEFNTEWLCLDCELMPWSSKAQELLIRQYAPTGASGRAALRESVVALRTTA